MLKFQLFFLAIVSLDAIPVPSFREASVAIGSAAPDRALRVVETTASATLRGVEADTDNERPSSLVLVGGDSGAPGDVVNKIVGRNPSEFVDLYTVS